MARHPDPRVTELTRKLTPKVEALIRKDVRKIVKEKADEHALVAAVAAHLDAGPLLEHIARTAAVRHEILRQNQGVAAYKAHEEIGKLAGVSRQNVEQRLMLTQAGDRKAATPIEELRNQLREDEP